MAFVELSIVEPENNFSIVNTGDITFRGEVTKIPAEAQGQTLYYRWYSSLFYPVPHQDDRYSINAAGFTSAETELVYTPPLGTHVITFGVSDQPGETGDDFAAIQHGGVAGGAEDDGQCLVHVFKANLFAPVNNAPLNRNLVDIQAEAPILWGIPEDLEAGGPPYQANEDYHGYNRLRYRVLFEPTGNPAGRPSHEYIPEPDGTVFEILTTPVINFSTSLPADATGTYNLTLFVEDNLDEGLGSDSVQIAVNF